jgi:YHS domain-containing protein
MDEVRDPVCGMMVDPANAAGSSEHEGQTYYFCSIECKEAFDMSPERYAIYDEGPRFTRAMGFPAPKFGFSTSGGAEFEPPSTSRTERSTSHKKQKS